MPTTQGEILTDVRVRLKEATATFWDDDDLRRWCNQAVRDIARRAEVVEATDTVAAVVGTQSYSAPTDALRIHRMEYQATGEDQKYRLEPREYNQMDSIWLTHKSITTHRPVYFTLWGMPPSLTFEVYPTPSVAGTFTLWYYQIPADLSVTDTSDAATNISVPEGWEELVVDFIEYHALRNDGDQRWTEAKQLYEERLDQLFILTRLHHDQAGYITDDAPFGAPLWLTMPDWNF